VTFPKQIRTFTPPLSHARHTRKHTEADACTHTHPRRSTDGTPDAKTVRSRRGGKGEGATERKRRTFADDRRDWRRGIYAHIGGKRTQCGFGRGVAALRDTGLVSRARDEPSCVAPPNRGGSTRRRWHWWYRIAESAITRNRARDSGQWGKTRATILARTARTREVLTLSAPVDRPRNVAGAFTRRPTNLCVARRPVVAVACSASSKHFRDTDLCG